MNLALRPLRFQFRTLGPVYFPPGKAANLLRGALGRELLVSGGQAVYEKLFAPPPERSGPSGFGNRPRPFVLRAAHLDGKRFPAGGQIEFGLNLFDRGEDSPLLLIRAWERIAAAGLGPAGGKLTLETVQIISSTDGDGRNIYSADGPEIGGELPSLLLCLAPETDTPSVLTLSLVTPLDLRSEGYSGQAPPPFSMLFARTRDRVANLCRFYGEGELPLDYAGMGRRAEAISLVAAAVRPVTRERRSGSSGQSHPLGGIVGTCTYSGDLGEFIPFLRAARWTGVGRHTVWGNGEIHVAGDAPGQ
jgi:hypothetical protein